MSFLSLFFVPYVSSEFWIQAFELPLPQQMLPTAEQGDSLPPLNLLWSLLGVMQRGSRNLNACSVGLSNSEGKEQERSRCSASFWKLHPFQSSQATKSPVICWSLAHGCGLAEPEHWGSSVVAVGEVEGSFPVVGL